ncbi:MAG: DUF6011 domain-containing protein [Thermomicrobiales bacterium]
MERHAHDVVGVIPLIVVPEIESCGQPARDGLAICRRCGRRLTTSASVAAGIGPTCSRKEPEDTQTPHRSGAFAQIPTKDLTPV